MKIAHVVATFPPHVGGMGRVVYDEATALVKRGHDVAVFTLRYPGYVYEADAQPFKLKRFSPIFKLGDAGIVPQLFLALKGFDLVHLHYPAYGLSEWVLLANILRRQKYVVTYHMDAAPMGPVKRGLQKIYDILFARRILRNANRVLTIDANHFKQTIFWAAFPENRLVELPNAVNTDIFKPGELINNTKENELFEKFLGKKVLLFVGNLLPVKRLDLLLEAMLLLPKDCILMVIGGGYSEQLYKEMATQLCLLDRVFFVGTCHDREILVKYYDRAAATVIPSDAESFSLVCLEAMASGCPVVAANIVALRGRVREGENGFLFAPGSVGSLVAALKKIILLNEDARKKIGDKGREMVEREYGLENHVDRLEKIYLKSM